MSTLTTYPDVEQRSDEWHKLRLGMVTASTIKNLLTPTLKVADNETSRRLIGQLVGERLGYMAPATYVNDDMFRGIYAEPFARDRYAEVTGVKVDEIGFAVRTFDGGAKLGASPDGLIGDDGGLEIKAPRIAGHIATIRAGVVPSEYVPQIQASLLVTGRSWWDFVSWFGGEPMFIERVYPDPEWQAAITEAVIAAEAAITEVTSDYLAKREGLPATEPIPDLEVVI